METKTIIELKNICTEVKGYLDSFQKAHNEDAKDLDECLYGKDKEYSINGIIVDIQDILTDVSFLTRKHDTFVKRSTYNERVDLSQSLSKLSSNLRTRSIAAIITTIENIRTQLRIFHPYVDKDRFVEFEREVNNIRNASNNILKEINQAKATVNSAEEIYNKIVNAQNQYNLILKEFNSKQKALEQKISDIEEYSRKSAELTKNVNDNAIEVSQKLQSVNHDKEKFNEFIVKICEGETQLESQANEINTHSQKIKEWEKSYKDNMDKANELIEAAKTALNYTNAGGLSEAYSSQLKEAKNWKNTIGWIIGAIILLIATIVIGIWIVRDSWKPDDIRNNTQLLFILIGKLSMIPFTTMGAIFCAKQYTKQKNIIEDYSYKTTIAKSIIAFSEELRVNNPDKYSEYLSTILKEIHQDPLRKRDENNDEISLSSTELLDKLLSIAQVSLTK